MEADVRGQRSRGRQRKRWIDVVKYNMEDLRLDPMDVENRAEWRQRTRVAGPSPEGFPARRRERERGRERQIFPATPLHNTSNYYYIHLMAFFPRQHR